MHRGSEMPNCCSASLPPVSRPGANWKGFKCWHYQQLEQLPFPPERRRRQGGTANCHQYCIPRHKPFQNRRSRDVLFCFIKLQDRWQNVMVWYGGAKYFAETQRGRTKFHTALVVVCLGSELNVHP